VKKFRKTIIDFGIPNGQIVIAPYLNGRHSSVIMFDEINAADYVPCDELSVKDMAKQVAKELHVKFKEV